MKKGKREEVKKPPFRTSLKKNIGTVRKLCPSYLPVSILAMLLGRAQPFAAMILSAEIVDMLVNGEDRNEIFTVAFIMAGIILLTDLLRGALGHVQEIQRALVSDRKNREIGFKAMSLDYDILERNSTLELIGQADGNTDKMGGMGGYLQELLNLFGAVFSCIAAVITMAGLLRVTPHSGQGRVYDFFGSPISYAVLLLILVLTIYVRSRCDAEEGRIRYQCDSTEVKSGRVYWFFFNLINNYSIGKDIRIFGMLDMIEKKGAEACTDIENAQKKAIKEGLRAGIPSLLIQNLFIAAVYAFVGIKAIYGMISIGEVTKYISAITLLQGEIGAVFSLFININTHNIYLESYNDLMAVENGKYEGTLPVEKRMDNEYELEFRNVSFHYPNNDRMIFKECILSV